jgi:membrane protease YdiL (CAAX protease family)
MHRPHSGEPAVPTGGRDVDTNARSLLAIFGVLTVWNILSNLVLPDVWYVPANAAAGLLIVALAFRNGADAAVLGLDPARSRPGMRLGLAFGGVAVLLVLAAGTVPWTRRFLEDDRFADVAFFGMLYQVLLRIPIGTALFEELAFRGVLFGMLARRGSIRSAAVGSSLLFGLWHVAPTLAALDTNAAGDLGRSSLATVAVVTGGVVATALAGLGFVWLRLRSSSLVTPVVVHAALNCTAYAFGWFLVAG